MQYKVRWTGGAPRRPGACERWAKSDRTGRTGWESVQRWLSASAACTFESGAAIAGGSDGDTSSQPRVARSGDYTVGDAGGLQHGQVRGFAGEAARPLSVGAAYKTLCNRSPSCSDRLRCALQRTREACAIRSGPQVREIAPISGVNSSSGRDITCAPDSLQKNGRFIVSREGHAAREAIASRFRRVRNSRGVR